VYIYIYLFSVFFAWSSGYVGKAKALTVLLQESLSPSASAKQSVFHPKTGKLGGSQQ